ncbi:hypothetical protein, partial [Reyranella sp.]|uniref:hypothetical protein n=1 Tax=Reyranella sp. TaxID=1929291 RepID=UPI0025F8D547
RKLADALCGELRVMRADRQWVVLAEVAARMGLTTEEARAAAKEAVADVRIRAAGDPIHIVCLI